VCKLWELKLTLGTQQWHTKAVGNLEIIYKIFNYFRNKVCSVPADVTECCTGHEGMVQIGCKQQSENEEKMAEEQFKQLSELSNEAVLYLSCPDTRS
jgi:hypothetical protein